MSITGIRPKDLSDSSEIEYSDARSDAEDSSKLSDENSIQADTNTIHNEAEHGASKNYFIDEKASKSNTTDSSIAETEKSTSFVDKSNVESTPPSGTTEKVFNRQETPHKHNLNRFIGAVESPLSSARYSMQFEEAIKEKLSSTMYQASPKDKYRSQIESTDESDIEVISFKEKTIEILSSSDESNLQNIEVKSNAPSANPKPGLVQPKISTQWAATSDSKKGVLKEVKLVSREFHDKELKKLQELKIELHSAEKLLEKISKSLPDGGRQLSLRIDRLRNDVHIKTQYISTLKVEDEDPSPPQQRQVQNKIEPLSWDDLSAAVNKVHPTHTGKQGLATFNAQRELTVERLKVCYIEN